MVTIDLCGPSATYLLPFPALTSTLPGGLKLRGASIPATESRQQLLLAAAVEDSSANIKSANPVAGLLQALLASALNPGTSSPFNTMPAPPPKTGLVGTQDGVRLNYTQSGPIRGQNILFVPGWRQTAAEWRKQVEYFSSSGYRVTTYDMRGHGESERPGFGYRISRFAADLNDLLTQLNLTDLSIVAHSMGSSITWALWDQYPEARCRINHLVLVDEPSVLAIDPHWNEGQAAKVSALFTPTGVYDLANNMEAQTSPLVKNMFTSGISDADFEWILSENKKMSDAHAAALLVDHALRDWRDVLPRIDVPSLVIAGEVSIFAAPGVAWIATQIPCGKSYTFSAKERGSHFTFWENPDVFNSVVEGFIKG